MSTTVNPDTRERDGDAATTIEWSSFLTVSVLVQQDAVKVKCLG